ncbi:hypothetical protein [Spirosoma sp. 209]|uniref:hypothetical protein n=1 Tax=Spirosoma sp. 209 TaxID=1955701 RepID=UPI00098D25E3|nr:hypothetical protein [Spirosoma sp. 209]
MKTIIEQIKKALKRAEVTHPKRISLEVAKERLRWAVEGTSLEPHTDRIYRAFSTTSRYLLVEPERLPDGMFVLSTMIAVGYISQHDLHALGDYFPGASRLFALALSMSKEDFISAVNSNKLHTDDVLMYAVEYIEAQTRS